MFSVQMTGYQAMQERVGPKVMLRTMNRTLKQTLMRTRTQLSKDVRDVYNVKARQISKAVSIKRISWKPAHYEMIYRGTRLGFDKNYATTTFGLMSARGPRRGARVKIRHDRGRKHLHPAFKHKGRPMFMRMGTGQMMRNKNKEAIMKVTGLPVPYMMDSPAMNDDWDKLATKHLPLEFDKAFNFYSNRK